MKICLKIRLESQRFLLREILSYEIFYETPQPLDKLDQIEERLTFGNDGRDPTRKNLTWITKLCSMAQALITMTVVCSFFE